MPQKLIARPSLTENARCGRPCNYTTLLIPDRLGTFPSVIRC